MSKTKRPRINKSKGIKVCACNQTGIYYSNSKKRTK